MKEATEPIDHRYMVEPELALMTAVLDEAIATFRSGLNSRCVTARRESREAEVWIRSRDITWIYSFENICLTLEIDAERVRAGLGAMKVQAAHDNAAKPPRRIRRQRLGGGSAARSSTPARTTAVASAG